MLICYLNELFVNLKKIIKNKKLYKTRLWYDETSYQQMKPLPTMTYFQTL